eukprot:UN02497
MERRFRHQSSRRKRQRDHRSGSKPKDIKRPDSYYIKDLEKHFSARNKSDYANAVSDNNSLPDSLRPITGMAEIQSRDFFTTDDGNISLHKVEAHFSIQKGHLVFAEF